MESLVAKVEEEVRKRPWRGTLENKESEVTKELIQENEKSFTKKNKAFFQLAKMMKISESEDKEIKTPLDLPLVDGSMEVLMAVTLQNLCQPKNAQRRDAFANGKYMEINNEAAAGDFIIQELMAVLKSIVCEKGKKLTTDAQERMAKRGQSLFLQAPDFFTALAILANNRFSLKDRTQLFDIIIASPAKELQAQGAKDQLRALNLDFYAGQKLWVDAIRKKEEKVEFLRGFHYKVWQKFVAKSRTLSHEEFLAIFPEADYKVMLWGDCLDADGKPSKDPKKFWTYVNQRKQAKRKEKEQRKAAEAQAKKF